MGLIILLFALCGVLTAIFFQFFTMAPFLTIHNSKTQVSESSGQTVLKVPSETPSPTNYPLPTDTLLPAATTMPIPEPIFLAGSGDTSVDVHKWDGPAVLHARYFGNENFVIRHYHTNSPGDIHTLISTTGPYEGTVPLDFQSGDQTGSFEIKAAGQWELQIQPLETLPKIAIPATIEGGGDQVFAITGTPDVIKADATHVIARFQVYSFGDNGQQIVFNEIAPYSGISVVHPSTSMLAVHAEGPWELEVTTR